MRSMYCQKSAFLNHSLLHRQLHEETFAPETQCCIPSERNDFMREHEKGHLKIPCQHPKKLRSLGALPRSV